MRYVVLVVFAVLLFLGMAPSTLCSWGHCPALADGSCDPAIRICGTAKRPTGTCTTVVKHNGRKTCHCVQ